MSIFNKNTKKLIFGQKWRKMSKMSNFGEKCRKTGLLLKEMWICGQICLKVNFWSTMPKLILGQKCQKMSKKIIFRSEILKSRFWEKTITKLSFVQKCQKC